MLRAIPLSAAILAVATAGTVLAIVAAQALSGDDDTNALRVQVAVLRTQAAHTATVATVIALASPTETISTPATQAADSPSPVTGTIAALTSVPATARPAQLQPTTAVTAPAAPPPPSATIAVPTPTLAATATVPGLNYVAAFNRCFGIWNQWSRADSLVSLAPNDPYAKQNADALAVQGAGCVGIGRQAGLSMSTEDRNASCPVARSSGSAYLSLRMLAIQGGASTRSEDAALVEINGFLATGC